MCECRPGFRYPEYIQGPYMGVAIERATEEEYNTGFHCLPNGGLFRHYLIGYKDIMSVSVFVFFTVFRHVCGSGIECGS